MSGKIQFRKWLGALGICTALAVSCLGQRVNAKGQQNRPPQERREQKQQKQQRQQQPAEHQQRQPERQQRQQDKQADRGAQRNANRPPQTNLERTNPSRANGNPNRPPSRNTPPARALTPQERQRNEQQFSRLSPQQQQELRERQRVWGSLTPQQRDHIKNNVLPKWQQLPPDRQRAIRSRLSVLKNMPESARNQHLNDPNFTRGMSEEDKATLRDLSHLHVGGAPEPPSE
jgi:hypothetical protein